MGIKRILPAATAFLGIFFNGCNPGTGNGTANIALNRAVTASSYYDYNLTAQLVTDGIVETAEPAWLKVATAEGELPRREKEWTVDAGPYSQATLPGSNFIEYVWSGQKFSAGCVRIVGTLVYEEGSEGWSIGCFAGTDGLERVGGIEGPVLPGQPRTLMKVTDPNKQTEEITRPARALWFEIPLEGAQDFNKFRIEFKQGGALYWMVNSVDFTEASSFGKSSDTGPYDSKESRGFNVLPSGKFSSAWMSADAGPQWLCIDLGASKKFKEVDIHWIHPAEKVRIDASEDGRKWKAVADAEVSGEPISKVKVRGGKGRFVRITMEGDDGSGHFTISEIEVMGRAEAAGDRPDWRLCRASAVEADGETVSSYGYDASSWMPAIVPGTVLYSYIAAGAVPDPNIADNNQHISESYFNSDFWYRWEADVQASDLGRRTLLTFDGINWKAEVFMNGRRLGDIAGAFKQESFDVTDIVRDRNVVAVHVVKPAHFAAVKEKNAESPDFNGGQLGADNPTFHATVGWDWIPTVRGRDMGIWNDVHLDFVDDVIVRKPLVQTVLAKDDTLASMTFSVEVSNLSDRPVSGELEGTIDSIAFSKAVALGAGESRTVTFTPAEFPQLRDRRIALWWPNGYGRPVLHPATYTFTQEGADKAGADLSYMAGIRAFTYKDLMSDLKMYINGLRFFPKGGNWGFSEYNLRFRAAEYDTAVRFHKEMNLNMIRNWVGQTGDEEFYEACDKHGIVVWQDFWLANPADGPDPDDEDMFVDNAIDYLGRIRSHACIGLYCGRNEGYPSASLDARLVQAVKALHGDIAYIPSSADDGVTGHGPYRAVEPDSYFMMPALKFHSERGMPAIMNYGSLLRTMTEDHLWPFDDVWGQHDFTRTGAQGDTAFVGIVTRRYGEQAMASAEAFTRYAQYVNYDGYRAMYEANNVARKGLLIWMSHSCWPSLAWQTYDYWFDKTAAFHGVRKACEPLHIQLNPATRTVQVVDAGCGSRKGLKATMTLTAPDGKRTYGKEAVLDIDEDMTVDALDVSDVPDGPAIVDLELQAGDGTVLSRNRYMRNFKDGKDTGDYRVLVNMENLEYVDL